MENYSAAAAAVWSSASLLNNFSGTSHGKHCFLKTKTRTFIRPLLVVRTEQDSWFSPSHPLAFLLAKTSRQSSHRHLQFLDILAQATPRGPQQITSAH